MFYEAIFEKLNESHVDYIVVGGVALVLHGVVRLTADLDLMVHLESNNLSNFVNIMYELGYKPKIPVNAMSIIDPAIREAWIKEKNMTVFTFYHPKNPIGLIDVFINEPIDYKEVKMHSINVKSGDLVIPIISIDDLIKLKKISGRPQDIADIAALREIKKDEQV